MPFTQNFYGFVGSVANVETVNGNFIVNGRELLTPRSGPKELALQISDIRSAVAANLDLEHSTKNTAVASIDLALTESQAQKPHGPTLKQHLDEAAATLQSAGSAVRNSMGLASVLLELGKWAATVFH
jgi:hypothetical protein